MSSQVISYRLSTEEVLELRQKALPGESDNQTAQRLIRESLGLSTMSTASPSLSTNTLDERIESILEERFSSLVNNQNDLLSRLQEVEAQVEKLLANDVDNLKTDVDSLQEEGKQLDAENLELGKLAIALQPTPMTQDQEPLTQAELAKRLNCDSGTLTKNRKKSTFEEWSRSKDPDGKSWKYLPDTQRYGFVEAQKSNWEARVDEVVGSL
jgi:regulator of replication initiation timing